jgi:hypothetical protein
MRMKSRHYGGDEKLLEYRKLSQRISVTHSGGQIDPMYPVHSRKAFDRESSAVMQRIFLSKF